MTTRSILLRKILKGWDQSTEAQIYLGWLIDADPRLDTGDVLREAVLEIMEGAERPFEELESKLDEICSTLEPDVAKQVKSLTAEVERHVTSMNASLRDRTAKIRELRYQLGLGRLETLALLADAQRAAGQSDNMSTSEIVEAVKKFAKLGEGASYEECVRLAREHLPPGLDLNRIVNALMEDSAQVSSLSRTTTDRVNRNSRLAQPAGRSNCDSEPPSQTAEELDHYYSYDVVDRLEQIVERAASLDPVDISVTNEPVNRLFQAAHEVYLYGFDVASIALCGSLIEHAMKDRLPPVPYESRELGPLIERASREGLLGGPELESARRVGRDRNKVMHDVTNLRSTAAEMLVCTRLVRNKLYRPDAIASTSVSP